MKTHEYLKGKLEPLLGRGSLKNIAAQLGVSDAALRRAIKRLGLKQPEEWVRQSRLRASRLGGEAARKKLFNPVFRLQRYKERNATRPAGYYAKFTEARKKQREMNRMTAAINAGGKCVSCEEQGEPFLMRLVKPDGKVLDSSKGWSKVAGRARNCYLLCPRCRELWKYEGVFGKDKAVTL